MMRTTQAVLEHHLEAFDSGDIDQILTDYAEDAILITPETVHRGHAQIRPVLQRLLDDVFSTCSSFTMFQQVVEGEIAYIAWSAESAKHHIPLATDTYVIRGGKIVVQTYTGTLEGK